MDINGIHLNAFNGKLTVSVEVNGAWTTVITERYDGVGHISHIVERSGMEDAFRRANRVVRHHDEPQQEGL